jgi:hypothetical protein
MRDLEEGLSALRPQCALTIAAIAVSFSDQYFFLIFRADSCVGALQKYTDKEVA